MGKEIKIIKKGDHRKFEDYTFVDNNNNIELKKIGNENDSRYLSSANDKKNRRGHAFKLRNNPTKDMKSRKSRVVEGHGTQSHSPVYE